ncbi:DNA translocase FtsK, partial [Rhodoblastus sp.]|uniref:DNA translocase FtsK n=1 Tax=Rhodoblastus sp. TaxID=1962975 RepID=UPI0025D69F99
MRTTTLPIGEVLPESARVFFQRRLQEVAGLSIIAFTAALGLALATWSIADPSLNHATDAPVRNALGVKGAMVSDLIMQLIGISSIILLAPLGLLGWKVLSHRRTGSTAGYLAYWLVGTFSAAAVASLLPTTDGWPLPTGLGGVVGDALVALPKRYFSPFGLTLSGLVYFSIAILALSASLGMGAQPSLDPDDAEDSGQSTRFSGLVATPVDDRAIFNQAAEARISPEGARRHPVKQWLQSVFRRNHQEARQISPVEHDIAARQFDELGLARSNVERREPGFGDEGAAAFPGEKSRVPRPAGRPRRGSPDASDSIRNATPPGHYTAPAINLLAVGKKVASGIAQDSLEQNARLLEGVLEDFSVKGDIVSVYPGPVVTLYEFEPAPGIKSSRVIGLADDIARSMSAVSARVAVVPGRNAIGIELPNPRRETVYLRELFASPDFAETKHKLAIALGKTIGGEPVIVDLAKMPHLLVAGTTGSGKSVAINTMILSLLYRLKPQECRLIMVDPKMLELSVYDGIPHLLTPVVTDPKKAVVALKWAVREMEDRYKKMSKLGVRNIDGFNARVTEAKSKGEIISRVVQTGFDRETGEAIYEQEQMDLSVLPYIVVIVDEMADLMMVAGKEIEGAIQRLAQMARAAGIHLIMATQRPSVDVITGTIKANFPTRISFQVTSKIDSRTILGEMGAEQLLGQGDMLYMAGGGRISRVHGPFVSDADVEKVVAHLKMQGQPDYLDSVTVEDEPDDDEADAASYAADDEGGDLYDRAVAIVLRDKKCSTSYVQRRLSVGYNKAASLVERMEKEGVVGPANHAGKRAILA